MKEIFPFENVRDKQKQLKEEVEKAVKNGENVLSHAPTGLGKTAATLSPALSYALENDKTVFFITPRHSQHEIAVETLKNIKEKHRINFTAADVIGKKWMCEGGGVKVYNEGEEEEPDCPRHDNTYDKNHQLTDMAKSKVAELKNLVLRAGELKKRCKKVCAYEISMHLASQADVIIGDYFHIFHPGVRDAIFSKSNLSLEDCVVIVDEGHNLPSRTRSLNSATITKSLLENASKEASKMGYYPEEGKLDQIAGILKKMARNDLGMEKEVKVTKKDFKDQVDNITDYKELIGELGSVAKEVRDDLDEESKCGMVANFLEKWKGKDEGFARILSRSTSSGGKERIKLGYRCLDPQFSTSQPLNKSHTSVVMSGTLKPLDMYMDILGFEEDETIAVSFKSPFPDENQLNLVVDKVTTRYKERDETMYQKIAWYILKSVESIGGNTGVFFPSYDFRDKIKDKIESRLDRPLFLEDRSMDKEEKKKFLEKFGEKSDQGAVLFGVIGGSFGEGVDFPGELMSGVMVVGVPLQKPDLEVQSLIDFYDSKFGRGWDYGYNFPAVNRALQAAGRCIRSKDDRGVVMFLDKRYSWSKYRKALNSGNYVVSSAPWKDIEDFFTQKE